MSADNYDGLENDLPPVEAEEHDGPDDMTMMLGHITILRGLDTDGDVALWYDMSPNLDAVTALGMLEMAKAQILDAHAAQQAGGED